MVTTTPRYDSNMGVQRKFVLGGTPPPPIIQKTAVRVRPRYIQVLDACKVRCCSTPSVEAAINLGNTLQTVGMLLRNIKHTNTHSHTHTRILIAASTGGVAQHLNLQGPRTCICRGLTLTAVFCIIGGGVPQKKISLPDHFRSFSAFVIRHQFGK